MNPIVGQNVMFYVYKDGNYRPFLCAMDCSITPTLETKEVRTLGDGAWRKVRGQKFSYRVSISGLIPFDESDPTPFYLLENYFMQMVPILFQIRFEDPVTALLKLVEGEALIKECPFTGPVMDFASASFEMEGNGAFTVSNSATVCNATIGAIEIGGGNPDIGASASVNYTGVSNAARLEYSVDGGAREVIFDPGVNGFFYLFGLSEGTHKIEVWAICDSGVDGEMNDVTFSIDSGGDPGPACAVPGTPALDSWAANVGVIKWAASSSSPANGYYWELRFASTDNLAQSATTYDTEATVTALEGVEYIFKVKALCAEGTNESSYVQVTFKPETPPSCSAPGTPVMSNIGETVSSASWLPTSPAPGDGYYWEVRQGVTLITSGTTSSTSVNITGLTGSTDYTFGVRSVCEAGVSTSPFVYRDFSTGSFGVVISVINWSLNEDNGNGSLVIDLEGSQEVNATNAGTGSFDAESGDDIDIAFTAASGTLKVTDLTSSTVIINTTGTGTINESFSCTFDHDYLIEAIVNS